MNTVIDRYQYLKIFSQCFGQESAAHIPAKLNILENRFKRRPFLQHQFNTLLSLTKNLDQGDHEQIENLKIQVDNFLYQFFRLDISSLSSSVLLLTANEIFLHRHFLSSLLKATILPQKENEMLFPLSTKPALRRLFCELLDTSQFPLALLNFLPKFPEMTRSIYDHLHLIKLSKSLSANRYQLFQPIENVGSLATMTPTQVKSLNS